MSTGQRSAVAGGVADKWGNRYEGRWTVWRGVLPVLRGEFDAIRAEPPDLAGEGAEFRLYGRIPDGPDEVHQCKRRRGTSWTVPALAGEGVLRPFGDHLAQGVRAVFASGTPSILETMAKTASRLPLSEWSASLNRDESTARDDLVGVWGVTERDVWDRLGRLEVHAIGEGPLEVATIEALAGVLEGDPTEALLRLADHLVDRAMARLTARDLWEFLREHGFSPRQGSDVAVSERIRDLNARYVEGVDGSRPPNLPLLARAEVDAAARVLRESKGPRVVVITGRPGSGKSTIIAQVCQRLAQLGITVGPLRLDNAAQAWTAEDLGTQEGIGFGGPPARILSRAAAGQQAVLVVDQLDALSVLAGRGETVLDGVRQMLAQANASEGVRLLIGCRRHDLQHDRQLRRLVGLRRHDPDTTDAVHVVDVGDLDPMQLQHALDQLGVPSAGLTTRLRALLANPFNLSILANIIEDAAVHGDGASFTVQAVRTRHDLLAEYDSRLARRLRRRLNGDTYAATVFRIARLLSDAGQLSFDRGQLADLPTTLDALTHEGVLAADGHRLRFFHEAYFDHTFALQHVQGGRTAADLLGDDLQDLIRRGQVRAVLALERQQDTERYTSDLRAILAPSLARSHVRAAVLAWLTDVDEPSGDELSTVVALAVDLHDPLHRRAAMVLASEVFARAFHARGLLPTLADLLDATASSKQGQLETLIHRIDSDRRLYMLFEAARYLPEPVTSALQPVAADRVAASRWTGGLLRAVFLAGSDVGPSAATLFCTLASTLTAQHQATLTAQHQARLLSDVDRVGESDRAPASDEVSDAAAIAALFAIHGIHALSTLAKGAPTAAVSAMRCWLESAAIIADINGATHAFDTSGPLPHQQTGLQVFDNAANGAPSAFVQQLTPILVDQLQRASSGAGRWRPAGASDQTQPGLRTDTILSWRIYTRGLDQEIYGALRAALKQAAKDEPDAVSPSVRLLTETDLRSAHELAAAAYAGCAVPMVGEALRWAADERVLGLPEGNTPGWAWGEVLAHVAAVGTDAERDEAIRLALAGFAWLDPLTVDRDTADAASQAAYTQLVVLSQIERRLADTTPSSVRTRLEALERVIGPAPSTPDHEVVEFSRMSPISEDEAEQYSDDDWLHAINTYRDEYPSPPSKQFEGGASQVAEQINAAAKRDPVRFTQLIGRIGPTANRAYINQILAGVNSVAQELDDHGRQALFGALRLIASWPGSSFQTQCCEIIGSLASSDLPNDLIELVGDIAAAEQGDRPDHDNDNGDEVLYSLSDAKGRATYAMAQLLGPAATRGHRTELLLPAVRAIAVDPADANRTWLPAVIVRTFLSNRQAAVEIAERWVRAATDRSLRAPELDRLAWQLLTNEAAVGAELVGRMIVSSIPEVRTRGGGLAALASLHHNRMPNGSDPTFPGSALSLAMDDPAARKGVAQVLAEVVEQLPPAAEPLPHAVEAVDQHLLINLLDDDDHDVREAAAGYAFRLTPPLDRFSELLAATAHSHIFQEHPSTLLAALHREHADVPETTLDLCEVWLTNNADDAGDIRTKAAGDANYVVDMVYSVHVGAEVGSTVRRRCLDLIDRLIEVGAFDAEKKADESAAV